MASRIPFTVHDALYGRITFGAPFASLLWTPVVQRMRHIRLSNIDSIDLPGIANLSRFEHVLGVAHLASLVGFRGSLSATERLALDAAAVLHDWAITSFGHLVEEAFQFVGASFEHETHLADLAAGESEGADIGGVEHRQILAGREIGLLPWITRVTSTPEERDALLVAITQHINGRGKYGKVISGTIDLDNIDNVTRMAYHLGLVRDGGVAIRLAHAMVGVDKETGAPIFRPDAIPDIEAWLRMRREVYSLLMLSEGDFAGKLMLIFATVEAFKAGQLRYSDWAMTDAEFFEGLRASTIPIVKETATRWFVGELWDMAPLVWFRGQRPSYTSLTAFSDALSDRLGRRYFAYAIKDKRDRCLLLQIAGEGSKAFGSNSDQWLLGFGSPARGALKRTDIDNGWVFAESYFNTKRLEVSDASESACLI